MHNFDVCFMMANTILASITPSRFYAENKEALLHSAFYYNFYLLSMQFADSQPIQFSRGTARAYEEQFSYICLTYFHFKLLKTLMSRAVAFD